MIAATRKHVLVAEDDAFQQQTLKMLLTMVKAEFTIVGNGEEAYKAYTEKNSSINFILMDLHMPKVDGFDATKKIREYEKSKKLPAVKIYGLSADDDKDTISKCSSCGMQSLLKKPLKKDALSKLML